MAPRKNNELINRRNEGQTDKSGFIGSNLQRKVDLILFSLNILLFILKNSGHI